MYCVETTPGAGTRGDTGVMRTTGADTPPRMPVWVRGTRVLEIVTLVVLGLAVLVEYLVALREGSLAGLVAAAVVSLAVILSYRIQPYAALVLFALGPLVASALGWLPTHNWSIACFGAFLLTLRGLPGLLTGVVIAAANLGAVGWYGGTLSVQANAEASIAAAAGLLMAASGSAIRGQRQYFEELSARTQEAIATRAAVAERSVAQERVRIARDLHDSIGHEIAVVSMHLGAAQVHLATDPDAASADLDAARAGVQAVLAETQDILRVLRVGADAETLAPTPDHGRLPALVESFRGAGVPVETHLTGLERTLPTGTSTAVFRIVQEALTNAERHGQGGIALRVDVGPDAVTIDVVNLRRTDGRDTSGGGNGLVGMRERATSAGGRLTAHVDGTVFSVRAELPATEGSPR
jgi:signal transduction histidine kinase